MLDMSIKLKVTDAAALGERADFRFVTTAKALDAVPQNSSIPGDVVIEGTMENTGGAYRLTGAVKCIRSFVCDRCLEKIEREEEYPFREDFRESSEEDSEVGEDGCTVFSGDMIDLAALIRDTILTAQPMQNLCRTDCRGLCSRCGANLNQGECGCNRRSVDPRLAALQDFMTTED